MSLTQVIDQELRHRTDRRAVIESEPTPVNARGRRPQTVPLGRMKVVSRNSGGRDVLSPRCRDSRRAAAGDLNHEAAAVTIELHREKVDSLRTDAPKVRKGSLETSSTEGRNQRLLQCGRHRVAVHNFWLDSMTSTR